MKKVLMVLLSTLLVLMIVPSAFAATASKNIKVILDGKSKAFSPPPQKNGNDIVLAIKPAFELAGVKYNFNAKTLTIIGSTKSGSIIVLKIGSKTAEFYGEKVQLSKAPTLVKGVPTATASALASLLDLTSKWNEKTYSIEFSKKKVSDTETYKRSLFGKTNLELNKLLINFDSPITFEHAKILLSKGANPNYVLNGSITPLAAAILLRDLQVAELLLQHGADPNFRTGIDDRPILHKIVNPWYALISDESYSDEQDLAAVKLLLKYKADPNLTGTKNGTTNSVLVTAAAWNRIDIAKVLLENGANPNGTEGSMPPLYAAIFQDISSDLKQFNINIETYNFRHPEIVKLLLEAGADPRASYGGMTMLEYANTTVATRFQSTDNGAKYEYKYISPDPEIVRLIVEYSNK